MKILSVLNARTVEGSDPHKKAPVQHELWPSSVKAITFVIAQPDAAAESFVAYAIDADGSGKGLYTIEAALATLPALMAVIAAAVSPACPTSEGPVGGTKPGGPTILPPGFAFTPPPGGDHFSVALAMIHQGVINSVEQLRLPDTSIGKSPY